MILLSSLVCVSQERPDRAGICSMLRRVCAMHPGRQRNLEDDSATGGFIVTSRSFAANCNHSRRFCALMVAMSDLSAAYRWLEDDGPAFGAPGVEPRWTSSEKDAVSTAYAASSRVWFTISHGTLNEIYYPTIDRPQTRDMELLFSDGETFFHEEKRDLAYDFHYIDSSAPAVRVTASDPKGRYTVTKEFISDPHHPVVLMNVKISGDEDGSVAAEVLCAAGSAFEWRRARGIRRGRSMWRGSAACWRGRARRCWRWERTAGSAGRRAGMWGRATAIRTCART